MKILVLNSGSSSLKFQLFAKDDLSVLASGLIEQIADSKSSASLIFEDASGSQQKLTHDAPVADHSEAVAIMS
ncbi:MAG: acetate kinase, partial [Desulfocapsa sp.]|nr:acetate kinase [Desulfocapsa sp.]